MSQVQKSKTIDTLYRAHKRLVLYYLRKSRKRDKQYSIPRGERRVYEVTLSEKLDITRATSIEG